MSSPRSGFGLGSLIVALVIILALGVGTVYAAIPNGNGKYFACLVKDTGTVRLVNFPKVSTCPKGEKLISWNAKGPQGPQGPQGPAGPADWNAIPNIPAGFADGADNEGVTALRLTTVQGSVVNVSPGGWDSATATCPAGAKVTGGGPFTLNWYLHMTGSHPSGGNSWVVYMHNTDNVNAQGFQVVAACLSVDPPGAISTAGKGLRPSKLRKHK